MDTGVCVATVFGRAWDRGRACLHTLAELDGVRACERPFYPFRQNPCGSTLVGLAWEGSPVASQSSYGGAMRHYLNPVQERKSPCCCIPRTDQGAPKGKECMSKGSTECREWSVR